MEIDSSLADMLTKVAVFLVVQALVYLILSSSSDVFSKNKMRSFSFKPARSVTIRRILAAVSDLPAGGEPSPTPKSSSGMSNQEFPDVTDDDFAY